jgi:hypothetical protein
MGVTTVGQTACAIEFDVAGLAHFSGLLTVGGSLRNLEIRMDPAAPGAGPACPAITAGRLEVQGDGTVLVIFGTGPAPCCQHGSVTLRR